MTVYDKGKYHDDSVREERLRRHHADHHIVYFLRWAIDRDLVSTEFTEGYAGRAFAKFKAGRKSIFWLFEWWDRCFVDDMLTEEGVRFADAYFAYNQGHYLADYEEILVADLPSVFHVKYTDEGYERLAARIDERWQQHLNGALPAKEGA